ncbi:HEPN domain-containing protein [Vibrio harveyi]|uniref:HEPN domain-containing protein n=1 Tax=Vibrio harveyi TaxID=669 RepID=UPI0003FAA115|nr:HEPN domain-containing protein [Vibrio harveyi]
MYKVEYLVLSDAKKTQCKTTSALKSLLQADSDVEIERSKIKFKKHSFEIKIKFGKNEDKSSIYFNISVVCKNENELGVFASLLKSVRKSLAFVAKTTYVVWDDLSLYYAGQAYPKIFEIENLMRLLITKFMLTNVGLGWTKERVPTDVQQSINSNNSDANYLNNVDFIQLKNFLFSENYPNHKDSLIKKLKSAKDFTNLELEEIKSLLPESNWDRFFQPLVGCEADFLKKRWDQLYELRCKVAHNKDFNHTNLEDVLKLTAELKPILDKALVSLDDIVISEDEKDDVFENVLTFYDSTFAKYMVRIQRLEQLLNIILERFGASAKNPHPMSLLELQKYVASMGILTDKQLQVMDKVRKVRNKIAHETFGTEAHEVIESQLELEKLIMQLEVVVKKL